MGNDMDEIFWTMMARKLLTMPEGQWETVLKDFDSKAVAAIQAEMRRLEHLNRGPGLSR